MKIPIKALIFIALVGLVLSCQTEKKTNSKPVYQRLVGDIPGDPNLDDPAFKTCNGDQRVLQYFNTGVGFQYKGEKTTLISKIRNAYKPPQEFLDQSGYLRIRFIVNCKGEAGRFRALASDLSYREKVFDKALTDQLLTIIKGLDGWEIMSKNNQYLDYYMYLIFKIDKGQLIEILP